MTEKEKAKAYDEVLKKASAAHKDEDRHLKATLERIFPELKEDDDERIKKELIQWVDEFPDIIWRGHYKKDIIAWLEKQGDKSLPQTNERAWLYLVSDVLTWKDGIGQYLDDPRVQELAMRLCSEYAQKLYNSSILSNSSNTGKNEQKSVDKIEPRFKVGDKIVNISMKYLGAPGAEGTISKITEDRYIFTDGSRMSISNQDSWELVSDKKPKFDPKTLQPFDRVLARDYDTCKWKVDFYSYKEEGNRFPYICMGNNLYKQCIPYNDDTKHLVGTTEEAPEYYKYWED